MDEIILRLRLLIAKLLKANLEDRIDFALTKEIGDELLWLENSLNQSERQPVTDNKDCDKDFYCNMTYEVRQGIWDKCVNQCDSCRLIDKNTSNPTSR